MEIMNNMNMNINAMIASARSFDIKNHFWQLPDGRVWSTAKAMFVDASEAYEAGFTVIPESPVDKQGNHSLEGLQEALVFYNLPRGELATADDIRQERDKKLEATDKYVLPDFPLDADKLAQVKEYRQALRDITKQSGFPSNVEWPSLNI